MSDLSVFNGLIAMRPLSRQSLPGGSASQRAVVIEAHAQFGMTQKPDRGWILWAVKVGSVISGRAKNGSVRMIEIVLLALAIIVHLLVTLGLVFRTSALETRIENLEARCQETQS